MFLISIISSYLRDEQHFLSLVNATRPKPGMQDLIQEVPDLKPILSAVQRWYQTQLASNGGNLDGPIRRRGRKKTPEDTRGNFVNGRLNWSTLNMKEEYKVFLKTLLEDMLHALNNAERPCDLQSGRSYNAPNHGSSERT